MLKLLIFKKITPVILKYVGGWKEIAILAIFILGLTGTVYAQYQKIQRLNVEKNVLERNVKDIIAERERIEKDMRKVESLLSRREEERKLLYAETNALKRKVNRLEEAATIEWLDTDIPEPVRLLRESRIR